MSTVVASEVTDIFDPLMLSIKAKLDTEFELNKLKGSDYATVYAKALEFALQNTIQLLLGADQRILIAAQAAKETQSTANLLLEADNIPKQGLLLDQQVLNAQQEVLKSQAEVAKITAENLNIPKQGALLDQQLLNLISEKIGIEAKTNTLNAELLNIPKQGVLLDEQALKLEKDTIKVVAETANEVKNLELITSKINESIADVALSNAKLPNIGYEGLLLVKQVWKTEMEGLLTSQQRQTLETEVLNVPKQGALLDAQKTKVIGETSLIPKQSQLIDAQILKLSKENLNLAKEGIILDKQAINLTAEGVNLGKQGQVLDKEVLVKQADVGAKNASISEIYTRAEANRSNSRYQMAQAASIKAEQMAKIMKVCVDSWNTKIAATYGVDAAFDKAFMYSVTNKAVELIEAQQEPDKFL